MGHGGRATDLIRQKDVACIELYVRSMSVKPCTKPTCESQAVITAPPPLSRLMLMSLMNRSLSFVRS